MEIIAEWSTRTGVRLNLEKTQILWLGKKSYDEPIGYAGHEFEVKTEVKYLRLVLTRGLTWKKHLDYLEEKNKQQIRLISYVNHLSENLTIESKRTVYHTVYLPTILYLSEIWADELKPTHLERLRGLQRKYLLALTGAYSSTNRVKLMNLLEVLSIDHELEYRRTARGKDAEEKKRIRDEFMLKQMEGYDRFYLLPFDNERVAEIRSKCAVWFLTAHGPFRTSRGRREESERCRFCEKGREDPDHLLFECRELRQLGLNREGFSIEDFERATRAITVLLVSRNS